MEALVLSIDQCRHLQELGLDMSDAKMGWHNKMDGYRLWEMGKDRNGVIPTYTLQEILEKLPHCIRKDKTNYWLNIDIVDEDICYQENGYYASEVLIEKCYEDNKILQALYDMLCWVIENGYLK